LLHEHGAAASFQQQTSQFVILLGAVQRLHSFPPMRRILTCLLGAAVIGLGLGGCWSDDTCTIGATKCQGSIIDECQQFQAGYIDWKEIADCREIDARCIDDNQGHAQCQYGP
jgi:hypothetical protein